MHIGTLWRIDTQTKEYRGFSCQEFPTAWTTETFASVVQQPLMHLSTLAEMERWATLSRAQSHGKIEGLEESKLFSVNVYTAPLCTIYIHHFIFLELSSYLTPCSLFHSQTFPPSGLISALLNPHPP